MANPNLTGNEAGSPQVRIRLSSRDSSFALPETAPIVVSTSLRRLELSTIVNELLQNDQRIPFEFLINGSFLRTSIDEFLTANGISVETVLDVEYIRALAPPVFVGSFEHDDWVSGVDVLRSGSSGQERVLTSSFDGFLRVWNMSSEILATSPAVAGEYMPSILTAKFITPDLIASGSLDRTVKLWKYVDAKPDDPGSATIAPKLILYGHKASVNSIAVNQSTHRILSASSDHCVGLWSTRKAEAPEAPTARLPSSSKSLNKRQKTMTDTAQRGPLALMGSHTQQVTSVIFSPVDATVGYSVSLDHGLKTWDLTTAKLVDTRTTSHSLTSVESLAALNLIAAGSMARHITLIDPRSSAQKVGVMTLRGHLNAVRALARDPSSDYGLVSGSYDGTCRIWDTRSTKTSVDGVVGQSVYTITRNSQADAKPKIDGDGVKIFDVCWDVKAGIISAGEDKMVQINRGTGLFSDKKQ